MAGQSDFTEDEWNSLHRGATGAGMLVALSERGFGSSFKESGAMAKYMSQTRAAGSSQLVRELAATKGTGWKVSSSIDEVRDGTIAELNRAVDLLAGQDGEDLADYRAFVLELAHVVSEAGKGGDDAEAAAIATIKEALGA